MDFMEMNAGRIAELLPERPVDAHKGSFGKILLLCGSRGYTGAAALAAMGALRCGAGLVYLGVPESIYTIEAIKLTEPIVFPLPDSGGMLTGSAADEILSRIKGMNAVLVGPGLGQSEGTYAVVNAILNNFKGPVVLDADGINVLSRNINILRSRTNPTILTPHAGEFQRIGGYIHTDRIEAAVDFAQKNNCIVLLKGHRTVITDGNCCYINPTGNPGMAVGGSGDVLAGMIVSLLGQGLSPLQAAACGAWLHGRAGDICSEEIGQYGMLPTDMLRVLPRLLK